ETNFFALRPARCAHNGLMADSPHILVVEDDRDISRLVGRYLRENECRVSFAADGREMDEQISSRRIDLVVLDVMLPGEDGLSLCRRLRARSQLPVVMLTAKGGEFDRIIGIEMGADDYLPKPFNPRELLARIRAVLRRRPPQEAPGAPAKDAQVVQFGDFEFDLSLRRLTKDGEPIALTTGEFSMLKALVRHPRQ